MHLALLLRDVGKYDTLLIGRINNIGTNCQHITFETHYISDLIQHTKINFLEHGGCYLREDIICDNLQQAIQKGKY